MSSSNRYTYHRDSTPFQISTSSSSPSLRSTTLDLGSFGPGPSSSSSLYRTLDSSPPLRTPSPSETGWPNCDRIYRHEIRKGKHLACELDQTYAVSWSSPKDHALIMDTSLSAESVRGKRSSESDVETTDRDARPNVKRRILYERQSNLATLPHVACIATSMFSIDRVSRMYPLVKLSIERYTALRQIQVEELGITVTNEEEEEIPLGWIGEEVGEGIINLLDKNGLAQKSS